MIYCKYLFFAIIFCFGSDAFSQIVVTVAGQAEIAGYEDGPAFEATFNNPHGIAVDGNGNVYTCDRWSHLIRKITPAGDVSIFAGQPNVSGEMDGDTTVALFNEPWGICIDRNGDVLVADTRNNKIRKVTQSGVVSTIAGSGNFGSSDGIGQASTFGNPTGIESDEDGNIYVADHLTHVIRKIDPAGQVSTIAGTAYVTGNTDGPGGIASFNRPYGLTLDNDGNILVADEWNHKIRKIDQNGIVTTFAGDGSLGSDDGSVNSASFNYPWDITVDSTGNVFVADGYNYLIRKISTDGTVLSFAGTLETTGATDGVGTLATFSGATGIAVSPLTKEIFVGDAYNHLVRKLIDLNQGVSVLMTANAEPTACQGEEIEVYASPDVYNDYYFYVDGQIAQNSSTPNFTATGLTAGTHQIKVVVQDNGNTFQSSPLTVTIFELPEPTISIVGETSFFQGDSAILISSQAESYFWSNGEILQTITIQESGDYTVEVSDTNGCYGISESVSIEVIENPEAPVITLNGSPNICFGGSTELQSNFESGNQWLKDGWPIGNAINQTLMVTTAGIYQVQAVSSTGTTTISLPITIEVLPEFNIDFTSDVTNIIAGNTVAFQILNQNVSEVSWDFGDPNSPDNLSFIETPEHTFSTIGEFSVQLSATDANGCRDSILKQDFIIVRNIGTEPEPEPEPEDGVDDIFIPTAFTPNGDGENDVLFVRGTDINSIVFNVYNHWGDMIFESTEQDVGWNGRHGGKVVQNGNYVYCANITKSDGTIKQIAGRVTVIR